MAFCTECGYKLPDGAIFCPNCGSKLKSPLSGDETENDNNCEDICYYPTEEPKNAAVSEPESSYKSPYSIHNNMGYPPSLEMMPKSNGKKIAAIVISVSVILILIAAVIISQALIDKNPYVGYWESSAIGSGSGEMTNTYLGSKVDGLFGIQINSDGTAFIASAYNAQIYNANWTEIVGGIEATDDQDVYDLTLMNGRLILENDDMRVVFEKSGKDIFHPTVTHGSLSGQGDGSLSEKSGSPVDKNVAGSGYVGDDNYYVSFIGATDFTDVDGDSAMRIYYEFTNNASYSVSADSILGFSISQDGDDLNQTYAYDDSEAYKNQSYRIRPGITIQCCYEFKYSPDGGAVSITASGWDGEEREGAVRSSYIPGQLPGKPAQYVIKPIFRPHWTNHIPNIGTLESCYQVSVQKFENTTDILGNHVVRIYYEFTNNSEYTNSLADTLLVNTYQDGISLDTTTVAVLSDTDINFCKGIAPGETTTASCVFILRNDLTPVEAEIESRSSYDAVGLTFEIEK